MFKQNFLFSKGSSLTMKKDKFYAAILNNIGFTNKDEIKIALATIQGKEIASKLSISFIGQNGFFNGKPLLRFRHYRTKTTFSAISLEDAQQKLSKITGICYK